LHGYGYNRIEVNQKPKRKGDTKMEKLTYSQIVTGQGYLSQELRDSIPKNSEHYVNFAYTDYGGDFFDKVCIEYFKENYPDNIVYEETCYYGQNAVIYGKVASDFLKETESYLLGFENIEEFFSELESKEKYELIESCSYGDLCHELGIDKDNIKESNKERILQALYDHTEQDHGVSFYSNIGQAIKDLNLGKPKFKYDRVEYEKSKGQKFLGL
jgi:hypothetical protein